MMRMTVVAVVALGAFGCAGAKDARFPTMEIKYSELSEGKTKERSKEREVLNATLIQGAKLQYTKAVDLLRAAETPEGGSTQKLMKAGRTMVPGEGVVLLGTVRREASGGSATTASIFQLAFECDAANFDAPGELRECSGYVMRVGRQWPAEVYDVAGATVSILPDGGAARGRVHAKSATGGTFSVELDGEFAASLAEYAAASGAAAATTAQ